MRKSNIQLIEILFWSKRLGRVERHRIFKKKKKDNENFPELMRDTNILIPGTVNTKQNK